MTDSWKADARFISRSHNNSPEQFVSADLRTNDSGTFSPTMIVNEGSNENNAQSPVTYTQDELESKLAEIRQEVTDEVRQNLSLELESEKTKYRAELRKESKEALDALISVLIENPNVVIQLRSHSDNIAGDDFNMELSQRRAQICVDYMVAKGIAPMRLIAKGMGETEPFVMDVKDGKLRPGAILNETFIDKLKRKKDIEKAHQYNRRTDFKVVLDSFYDSESDRVLPKKK